MSKHWDYAENHDLDDDYDYVANGYVYWYGKYFPKEEMDALFTNPLDNYNTTEGSLPKYFRFDFLAIAGIGATGFGIHKKVMPAIKHKLKKNDEFVEVQ